MGVNTDYFVAATEAEAAEMVDLADLPDAIDALGIDPAASLGALEELLTGRSFEEILEDPETGRVVASRDGQVIVVVSVNPSAVAALAGATDQTLGQVLEPWSESEMFWGPAEPEVLAEILHELADLARAAQDSGHGMYCRVIS